MLPKDHTKHIDTLWIKFSSLTLNLVVHIVTTVI
jgi:hypothetical protein